MRICETGGYLCLPMRRLHLSVHVLLVAVCIVRYATKSPHKTQQTKVPHLRRGRPGDHARGGVLDLHLVEEDVAVLGQLDLAGAADEHLEGAAGAEVGLEDVLQAAGGGHVDRPGLVLADDLGVGGELLQAGRHGGVGYYWTQGRDGGQEGRRDTPKI